jgi:S-DNA-T family DNA segregation ATPase FtsK/SpoIIIE
MARRKTRRRTTKTRRKKSFLEKLLFGSNQKSKRSKKKKWKIEVEEHVAQEIAGIVITILAIISGLSLAEKFGPIGNAINVFIRPIFGHGVYLLPAVLAIIGVKLIFNKRFKFTQTTIVGLVMLFISILSILHLSVDEGQILEMARQGQTGGYIGFVTNYIFRDLLNIPSLGTSIIFVGVLLISISLSLHMSLKDILAKLFIIEFETKSSKTKKQKTKPISIPSLQSSQEPEPEGTINIIKPKLEPNINNHKKQFTELDKSQPNKLFKEDFNNNPKEIEDQKSSTLEEEMEQWEYPNVDLLENKAGKVLIKDQELRSSAKNIENKLEQFGISVQMQDVHVGPAVIQYTLKPDEGVKLSKITSLKNDLALALAAKSIRIEAPIPGKSLVGIEVPSENRILVRLKELITSPEYQEMTQDTKLALPLGRDVSGKPIVADLVDMPHLLIAGATNSGKSVCTNIFLNALLFQNSPAELKLILVDPKQVELRDYNDIPHLLTPVITDPDKAANALKWAVAEMNRRYGTLSEAGCRNIDEYNADDTRERKMPKIVIMIDELADLMMSNGKEIEAHICRLAQMARAVGMHLIIATQRPSVDIITGLIKANIPSRIAFSVSSSVDSRTILDATGAEDLLGKGDMLYLQKDYSKPRRIQGAYIAPLEIKKVTNFLKLGLEPEYKEEVIDRAAAKGISPDDPATAGNEEDDLYGDAFQVVMKNRKASASLLQRRLKVGYARAARILDLLEENGVIGPVNGSKPREVYLSKEQ